MQVYPRRLASRHETTPPGPGHAVTSRDAHAARALGPTRSPRWRRPGTHLACARHLSIWRAPRRDSGESPPVLSRARERRGELSGRDIPSFDVSTAVRTENEVR